MAETDDIVASLRAWAPLVASGYTVPAAGQVMENAATALTERDAQIERLTRERDEAIREMSGWAAKAGEAEGRLKASEWAGVVEGWKDRATTAERERDEARAEVGRLRELFRSDGEQHAQFVKNLTKAHEDRITKYADAFNEIRAEVERLRHVLIRTTELLLDTWDVPMSGDPEDEFTVQEARAALTKGGENGDA